MSGSLWAPRTLGPTNLISGSTRYLNFQAWDNFEINADQMLNYPRFVKLSNFPAFLVCCLIPKSWHLQRFYNCQCFRTCLCSSYTHPPLKGNWTGLGKNASEKTFSQLKVLILFFFFSLGDLGWKSYFLSCVIPSPVQVLLKGGWHSVYYPSYYHFIGRFLRGIAMLSWADEVRLKNFHFSKGIW